MEWYDAMRRYREEKNAANPGRYTVTAVAARAGQDQSSWSRMELGFPKRRDGRGPDLTMHKMQLFAIGLEEEMTVIYRLCGLTPPGMEEPTWNLAVRLRSLMASAPLSSHPHLEETIMDIARVLVSKAA